MPRILVVAFAFLGGLAAGALVASHVWLVSSRSVHEASLAQYLMEQEHLANRAYRSGDYFREMVHRLNVADAQSELGFRWLQRMRNVSYWWWFKSPWQSYWVVRATDDHATSIKVERGRRILESHYRAAAALALERFRKPDLAETQWSLAEELLPSWTREQHRSFQADSPFGMCSSELDAAYLDSQSYEELDAALKAIRKQLGVE
jgi:hypothetical protein